MLPFIFQAQLLRRLPNGSSFWRHSSNLWNGASDPQAQIAVAVGFAVLTAHISLFHLYVRDTGGQLSRHLATTA